MRGKYETYIVPYLAEIKQWARLGIEEREIARKLGVAAPTFSGYKKKHPELRDAVRDGRQDAVLTLKNKLFEVAAGKATTTTVKTYTTVDKDGSTRKHVDKIVVQHPPSVSIKL